MSRIRLHTKYEPEDVMPWLHNLFYIKLKDFLPVKMYLVGSRGRTPLTSWDRLKGKDWDVAIEFSRLIIDSHLLLDPDFNVDILVTGTKEMVNAARANDYNGSSIGIELFPNTPPEFKKYLI